MAFHAQSGNGQQIARVLEDERRQAEHLVAQLSEQAARQQRRAIEGLIALPAAMALRLAEATLRIVTFMARGLEVLQRTASETREESEGYRMERERMEAGRQVESPRA